MARARCAARSSVISKTRWPRKFSKAICTTTIPFRSRWKATNWSSNRPRQPRELFRADIAGLSTPFHKYDHVCCVDFRFWRGATREHPPKWGCDRGATKPEPKSDATLQAAVLFGPDVVAHSLQTPEWYALVPVRKHLATRLGQIFLVANLDVFM